MENKSDGSEIIFWGIKIKSHQLGKKEIILLTAMFMIFFVVLVALLKVYILPMAASLGGKKILSSAQGRISSLIQLFKGRSP